MSVRPDFAKPIKVVIAGVPNLLAAVVRKAVNEEPDMEVLAELGATEPLALESRGLVDVVVTASATSDLPSQYRELFFGPMPVPVVAVSVDGKRITVYSRLVTRGGGIEGLTCSIREAVTRSRPRVRRYTVMEIGSWTTAEGTVPATLDFESLDADAQELPAWASGAATGALGGALAGSAAGPLGALIGGVTGGALGAAGSLTKPQPAPQPTPAPTKPPAAATAPSTPTAPSTLTAPPPPAAATAPALTAALQQLAAILPVLMQAAASGGTAPKSAGKSFGTDEIGAGMEALEPTDWEFASLEGGWTIP